MGRCALEKKMILRTMLFDVGGTLETYSFTKEYRVKNTAIFRKFLAENGLTISVDDEELCEIISSGIRAYRRRRGQIRDQGRALPLGNLARQ